MPKDADRQGRDSLSKEVDRLLRKLHPAVASESAPEPLTNPPPPPTLETGAAMPIPASNPSGAHVPSSRASGTSSEGVSRPAIKRVAAGPSGQSATRARTIPVTPVAGRRPHNDPFPPVRLRGRGLATDQSPEHQTPARVRDEAAPPTPLGVWARATLGVVLAGALTQWPYGTCGFSIVAYLLAATMVMVAGAWAAQASWHTRIARAHILALLVIFIGAVLAAHQILPRVGYAAARASWGCPG